MKWRIYVLLLNVASPTASGYLFHEGSGLYGSDPAVLTQVS